MRKKFLLSFLGLLCFVTAFSSVKTEICDASDIGNYIAVKADPDDLVKKELWTFMKTGGTSGSFKVNTSSYTPTTGNQYECALLVTNENGLFADDNQVIWVKNDSILGNGNLSSNLEGSTNCCQDSSGACGASNCDWTGAQKTFTAAFGSGWSDKCSGEDCNLSQSDTVYSPAQQILCLDTWQTCDYSKATCLDEDWLCDEGVWQKCPTGCNAGACAEADLTITASPTSASIVGGTTQTIVFTVEDNGKAVNGARINTQVDSERGTLSPASCNTNASGQCSIIFTSSNSSGVAEIKATAAYTGIESNTTTVEITVTANTCATGTHLEFDDNNYNIGETITLEGMYSPVGTVFSLCLYDPSGAKSDSKEGVITIGLNMTTVTAKATAGEWTGILKTGTSCSNTLSSSDTCRTSVTVEDEEETAVSGWQCTSDHAVNENPLTTIPCSTVCGGEGGCDGTSCPTGTSDYCATSAEACVCGTTDGDEEDTAETPTSDQPLASIARCDTNSWIFCNPLAGTIESLTEAGTKSVQALLGLIGTIALLFLVIAGATYMTAAGDEEKIKNAKKIITGTVIGLGIALVSFSLLQAILDMLNGA
ncbi:MAG: hypothetical protein WC178_00065 [Candidatus Paceibacterota bacterium]